MQTSGIKYSTENRLTLQLWPLRSKEVRLRLQSIIHNGVDFFLKEYSDFHAAATLREILKCLSFLGKEFQQNIWLYHPEFVYIGP